MEWPEGARNAPSRELVQGMGDWELQVADIEQHFGPRHADVGLNLK
jgi:hypothetical protein